MSATMNASEFALRTTQCGGLIQKNLTLAADTDVTSVMENLATVPVNAHSESRLQRKTFDVLALGVAEDNAIWIKVSERWSWRRILKTVLVLLVIVGALLTVWSLTYALAFDDGRDSIIDTIQIVEVER